MIAEKILTDKQEVNKLMVRPKNIVVFVQLRNSFVLPGFFEIKAQCVGFPVS